MATINIKSTKRFDEFRTIFKANKKACLVGVGEKWKTIATNLITSRDIIDTGTLKRTVDFNVTNDELSVGSPMDYAKYVEKQRKGGFLKDSVMNYIGSYKSIITQILRKGIS